MHDHDDGIKLFLVGNIKIRAYHEKRNGEIYTHVWFRKFSTIIEQSCIWGCIVQHVSDDIQKSLKNRSQHPQNLQSNGCCTSRRA